MAEFFVSDQNDIHIFLDICKNSDPSCIISGKQGKIFLFFFALLYDLYIPCAKCIEVEL
jgi:hypothetical protein